jgi:two-component system response regulator AlgR
MRVLVCDDEQLARDRLKRLVDKIENAEVVAEAANGREAIIEAQSCKPDVVLMDIRMPEMDGMEAAEHLGKMDNPPAVIFCTAYDEHALQAFRVHAVDYLLKPVNAADLTTALTKAKTLNRVQLAEISDEVSEEKPRRRGHISARTHRGLELVPVDDVRYFLADQKYVTVCFSEGEVLIDETLKELETEFGDQFVRIHRNALVALRYIEGMEMATAGHHQVRLRGVDERLTVSRRHVAGLRRVLQSL